MLLNSKPMINNEFGIKLKWFMWPRILYKQYDHNNFIFIKSVKMHLLYV